ncbi:MAG: hypothetical protein ACI93E_000412 [Flavobacteriales bacterium]|jgi:hypothetical protein
MNVFTIIISAWISAIPVNDNNLRPIDEKHFLIYGDVIEQVYGSENRANAPNTRVIVYRENEIYVAFKSDARGEYIFNLPLGHKYELTYGGENFVNKRIVIDATNAKVSKSGYSLEMNMSLFRPVEEMDYTEMDTNPVVSFSYDQDIRDIVPDLDVVDAMWRKVDKLYKKSEKMALKN